MFANAESLFYYTAFSRPTKKLLSQEEIKRLLAQAIASSNSPTTASVTVIEGEKESPANVSQGDMTIIELGESQFSMDHESRTVAKSKEGQSTVNYESMAIADIDNDDEGEDGMHSNTSVDNSGDQQQAFAKSDGVLGDGSNGKIQQEMPPEGQGSSEGAIAYDGVADGRIPDMESTQYEYDIQDIDMEQNATNYENYSDQIEVQLISVNFSYY